MMISTDPDKAPDKIQHPFMVKILGNLEIQGSNPNLIKNIY